MYFKVLGPLEMSIDERLCTPHAAKVRQVLALILFRANQVVSLDSLIEELWGNHPPRSAVTTTQTYIYQLRKTIAGHTSTAVAEATIRTVPPGYVLSIDDHQLDSRRFSRLVEEGRELLSTQQLTAAAQRFRDALDLWSGPPLADVQCGSLLSGYETHMKELRLSVLELRVHAEMQLGHHRKLVAELKSLVQEHPYNEWLHAQLMISLDRSGRRGEALIAYQNARHILNEELGLDPSAELQQLQVDVLRGVPAGAVSVPSSGVDESPLVAARDAR
jgi:SARP family transcriptional regulator, regulator of embCAB operon